MDRRAALRLWLLGFSTLFLELVLIRYLGGNVWNLSYFPNLVLMAVFVGMGVGFVFHHLVSERLSAWLFQAASLGLFGLVAVVTFERPVVPGFKHWGGDVGGEVYFTDAPVKASDSSTWHFLFWFVAVVVIFAFLSQRTAKLFRRFPALKAYTLDITGSCAGIVAFMLVSFLRLPAWSWFCAFIPLFVFAMDPGWSKLRFLGALPLAAVAVMAWHQDTRLMANAKYQGPLEVAWSPYQKVEYADSPKSPRRIYVNGVSHQAMFTADAIRRDFYQVPHRQRQAAGLPPYKNVLVIGAGSGNDVAAALMNGAEHVDAVEIDPVIAALGRKHHPAQPYSDPRVRVIVDDARAVMTRARTKYDLIVFALTDSLVKVSSMAQLRLENYLFTADSIRRAYALLAENGDVVLYNHYRKDWLAQKFQKMIHDATDKWPLVIHRAGDFQMFLVGDVRQADAPMFDPAGVAVPTDDWPFPYLQERGVPKLYKKALAAFGALILVLMIGLQLATRRDSAGGGARGLATKVAFVLMGVAFLLLETKSIVQFSLLFGTTWLNSSLVFLAVLALVLCANWTATLFRGRAVLPVAYLLLLGSCLVTLVYPLSRLLALESGFVRFLAASLMTFSPIFFANLIFSVTFRDQAVPEHLFGWNLLGATVGGILEYASLAVGYNALAVIVAVCYTVVFVLLMAARGKAAAKPEPEAVAKAA